VPAWGQELGARGCVVQGDRAYYRQFGFESDPGLQLANVRSRHFQRQVIDGESPQGVVNYRPAFGRFDPVMTNSLEVRVQLQGWVAYGSTSAFGTSRPPPTSALRPKCVA
jgi:hypothetical protein